jgi:DNA-binding CsgD family transcriptional regulator
VEANNLYTYVSLAWWGFARLYTLLGNLLQAEEWYERLFRRWKESEDACLIIPIALDAVTFFTNTGQLIKARQWFVELDQIARKTANPVAVAALWESQGVMKAREGLLEQAIQALRQAVEDWDRLKRRFQQALASQRLAQVLLIWARRRTVERAARQAARTEAETLLDKAFAVYEDLSIPVGIAEVQALRARTQLEAQRKRRRTLEARHHQADLTEREMQVLAQLAAGRTNREIAIALSISVGTVGVHVSHILTKLKCVTRTQAVSNALAKGWVSSVEET